MLRDHVGRQVRLTEERLEYILGHPEMRGMEGAIEQTVREPQQVCQSRTDVDVALFYRRHFETRVGDKWLCVVVKYVLTDAFVVTAYLTDSIKKGRQPWPVP